MSRKALLLGRNGDKSLGWCCNYDARSQDPHGLGRCDVQKMRDALRQRGWSDDNIYVVGPDCTTEGQLIDYVDSITGACAREDQFLFYFSGHTLYKNRTLRLVLDRGRSLRTYSGSKLIEQLQSCCAVTKLLILDCCYAEGITEVWEPGRYDNLRILVSTKSLAYGKEVEGLEGGIFTHCLCEALTNPAHWTHLGDEALVDAKGRIWSDRLLRWLKRQIQLVGQAFMPDLSFPIPTGDSGHQDEPWVIAEVPVRKVPATPRGWSADLIERLRVIVRELNIALASAVASYAYCRERAESNILPYLGMVQSADLILATLCDPGYYCFLGNRLKFPLLTFVAHLTQTIDRPNRLGQWLVDATDWLIKSRQIDPQHVAAATDIVTPIQSSEPQPHLMICVAPDLTPAATSYGVSWHYIDEYGDPARSGESVSGETTQEDLVKRILAAVHTALPGRTPCKPQIEVLLPFALLSDDAFVDRLEQAAYRNSERTATGRLEQGDLAWEFPFVLRCWERWFERSAYQDRGGTDARALWRSHCGCLSEAAEEPCLQWLKPRQGQRIRNAALLQIRPLPPARPALALASANPIDLEDLVDLLNLGIPILLWPRHCPAPTQVLRAMKQSLVADERHRTLKALPHALRDHRCREAALMRSAACDFSLLWEDPERVIFELPSYDTTSMG